MKKYFLSLLICNIVTIVFLLTLSLIFHTFSVDFKHIPDYNEVVLILLVTNLYLMEDEKSLRDK